MNFENNIPFDPGYGKHLDNFYINVDYAYESLNKLKNFNQKKFQFQKYYNILFRDINKYINFYIGCMLWALFIKQFENKEISENPALNQNFTDEDGLFTVNFIKEFLPKFEKDVKYYLNKNLKFEENIFKILEIYTEFLKQNKHFTDAKTSSDLVLPFKIENPDYNSILKTIEEVTTTGNFDLLRDYKKLILDNAV